MIVVNKEHEFNSSFGTNNCHRLKYSNDYSFVHPICVQSIELYCCAQSAKTNQITFISLHYENIHIRWKNELIWYFIFYYYFFDIQIYRSLNYLICYIGLDIALKLILLAWNLDLNRSIARLQLNNNLV